MCVYICKCLDGWLGRVQHAYNMHDTCLIHGMCVMIDACHFGSSLPSGGLSQFEVFAFVLLAGTMAFIEVEAVYFSCADVFINCTIACRGPFG